MDGLIIKEEWLDKIFDKNDPKTMEVRGSNTHKRGTIYLIQSGSKMIVGQTDLVDSIELSEKKFNETKNLHKINDSYHTIEYSRPHGWMFENTIKFDNPIKYDHPQGSVIWVKDIEKRMVNDND